VKSVDGGHGPSSQKRDALILVVATFICAADEAAVTGWHVLVRGSVVVAWLRPFPGSSGILSQKLAHCRPGQRRLARERKAVAV
jgi:hypothetical protein